jgi:hypothetical protein
LEDLGATLEGELSTSRSFVIEGFLHACSQAPQLHGGPRAPMDTGSVEISKIIKWNLDDIHWRENLIILLELLIFSFRNSPLHINTVL